MKKNISPHKTTLLFIVLLIGMSFLYRYDKIITLRPCSIHQHRQCDCLAITYNYYQYHTNFFEPQTNLLTGRDFDGKNVSELPILHYGVAQLWKVFGYHEWIYRLVVLLIMYAGLLALFKVFQQLLNDPFWQIILPLWLFSSPILIYYGNNFLADVPALSFAFAGWYFFTCYVRKQRTSCLIWAFVFFCLAMLLKITAGMNFLAFGGLFLTERMKIMNSGAKPVFKKPALTLTLIIITSAIVFAWYFYAYHYNSTHLRPDEAPAFLTGILPIWGLSYAEIIAIVRIILDFQIGNYFNTAGLLMILGFFVIVLLNYKKQKPRLLIVNIIIFLSCIGGIILWFRVFDVHDYYLTNYLVFIPATCLTFFWFVQTEYPRLYKSLKLKIPVLLLVVLGVCYGQAVTKARYASADTPEQDYSPLLSRYEVDNYRYAHWMYPQEKLAFETITPYLRSIGISEQDKVFSFPEPSSNITLYLMRQRGIALQRDNGVELMKYLTFYKDLHIKYFILGDSSLLQDDLIKKILSKKIGQYQTVSIYDISRLDSITGNTNSVRSQDSPH